MRDSIVSVESQGGPRWSRQVVHRRDRVAIAHFRGDVRVVFEVKNWAQAASWLARGVVSSTAAKTLVSMQLPLWRAFNDTFAAGFFHKPGMEKGRSDPVANCSVNAVDEAQRPYRWRSCACSAAGKATVRAQQLLLLSI